MADCDAERATAGGRVGVGNSTCQSEERGQVGDCAAERATARGRVGTGNSSANLKNEAKWATALQSGRPLGNVRRGISTHSWG